MRKTLILIALVVCLATSYSYAQKGHGKGQTQATPPQASGKNLPEGTFDPMGLLESHPSNQLMTFAKGFGFTEGPAVDQNGNIFFTDQPNDRIYRWDAFTHRVTLFLEGTGRANGMAFDADGNLITCSDLHGEIWKIYPDGHHDVLIDNYNGKLLNGPNDVWINPVNGGMYFTDPMFPRPYWDDEIRAFKVGRPTHSEQEATGKGGHVYYLAPGATELVRVTTDPGWDSDGWPNGVVGTPDGSTLYVNKWYYDNMGGTWAFDIDPNDGTLSNMRKVTDWGGDGMSMDNLGNFYISNGEGVMAFGPTGNHILTIPTGSGATNNTFGLNNNLLFITGPTDRVTGINMTVEGADNW